MNDDEPIHDLTHVPNTVGRLVPACTCGWWSIDGSHWRFEQHLKKVTQP